MMINVSYYLDALKEPRKLFYRKMKIEAEMRAICRMKRRTKIFIIKNLHKLQQST